MLIKGRKNKENLHFFFLLLIAYVQIVKTTFTPKTESDIILGSLYSPDINPRTKIIINLTFYLVALRGYNLNELLYYLLPAMEARKLTQSQFFPIQSVFGLHTHNLFEM